jgi:hypothetical protein
MPFSLYRYQKKLPKASVMLKGLGPSFQRVALGVQKEAAWQRGLKLWLCRPCWEVEGEVGGMRPQENLVGKGGVFEPWGQAYRLQEWG